MTMKKIIPSWELVTNNFKEPTTCEELLTLLTLKDSFSWQIKQFYEKENLILFAEYTREKLTIFPHTDKYYFHLLLRTMYLYRTADDTQSAYNLATDCDIDTFIETTLHFKTWDSITRYIGLSYLLSKYNEHSFSDMDQEIFERVLFDTSWHVTHHDCFSHNELFSFYLWYIRKFGRTMEDYLADDYIMAIASYLNTYSVDLTNTTIINEYAKWVEMFTQSTLNKDSLRVHQALLSHLILLTGTHTHLQLDDYCHAIRNILFYSDEEFLLRYEELIGRMISYIPFYGVYQSKFQLKNFEQLISLIDEGNQLQIMMLQKYMIPLLIQDFDFIAMYLVKEKELPLLSYILFTIFTEEDRTLLSDRFEMEPIYFGLERRIPKN